MKFFKLAICLAALTTFMAKNKSYAQIEPLSCGVENKSSEAWEQAFRAHRKARKKAGYKLEHLDIPVVHHVIRLSDGSGGASPSEIAQMMERINAAFEAIDVSFYDYMNIDYINDTELYFFTQSDESRVRKFNYVAGVINVYYATSNQYCGYAYIPSTVVQRTSAFIFMNDGCLDGEIGTHEFGHAFSLYHTHGKTNNGTTDELVNGSNCETAGDNVCDTPADPNLAGVVDSECNYTGTATDANGEFYSPFTNNIMAYTNDVCREEFTPGQYERMEFSSRSNYTFVTGTSVKYVDGIPYRMGFEQPSLDWNWLDMSTENGDVSIEGVIGNGSGPFAGANQMVLGFEVESTVDEISAAALHIDLSNAVADVVCSFRWKDFSDVTDAQDGIYVADDPEGDFVKIFSFNPSLQPDQEWKKEELNLTELITNAGFEQEKVIIKFQQMTSVGDPVGGIAIDEINIFQYVNNFPYSRNFDTETDNTIASAVCQNYHQFSTSDWFNARDDDGRDWFADSDHYKIGADHTSGEGKYVFCQAASDCGSKVASLESPVFHLQGMDEAEIDFWYYMTGVDVGTMSLEVKEFGTTNWTNLWTTSASPSQFWRLARVDITPYIGKEVVFRINYINKDGFDGIVALDDIYIGWPLIWQLPYPNIDEPGIFPGIVESVNYDYGGEATAYHDNEPQNITGGSRLEGVDTRAGDGGEVVDATRAGEYMEYTVFVEESRGYDFDIRVAMADSYSGQIRLSMDGVPLTGVLDVPQTGGYNNFVTMRIPNVKLETGLQVMRIEIVEGYFAMGQISTQFAYSELDLLFMYNNDLMSVPNVQGMGDEPVITNLFDDYTWTSVFIDEQNSQITMSFDRPVKLWGARTTLAKYDNVPMNWTLEVADNENGPFTTVFSKAEINGQYSTTHQEDFEELVEGMVVRISYHHPSAEPTIYLYEIDLLGATIDFASIHVNGGDATLVENTTTIFTGAGYDENGRLWPLPKADLAWSTEDPDVATASAYSPGSVYAANIGRTKLYLSYQGMEEYVNITIIDDGICYEYHDNFYYRVQNSLNNLRFEFRSYVESEDVTLFYSINGAPYESMTLDPGYLFTGELADLSEDDEIDYYFVYDLNGISVATLIDYYLFGAGCEFPPAANCDIDVEDYTVTTEEDESNLLLQFTSKIHSSYVTIHYSVNGEAQQNYFMANNAGVYEWTIGGLNDNDIVSYYFNYQDNPQSQSGGYAYEFGVGCVEPDEACVTTAEDFSFSTQELLNQLQFNFESFVNSTFVTIHYSINGEGQLNYFMNSVNGTYAWDIIGLNEGDVINFYFIFEDNPQTQTSWYSYTFGSSCENANVKFVKETEVEEVLEFSVWPNPANDALYMQGVEDGSTVIVSDYMSVPLLEVRVANSFIDVSNLVPGMYLITSEGRTVKFYKN